MVDRHPVESEETLLQSYCGRHQRCLFLILGIAVVIWASVVGVQIGALYHRPRQVDPPSSLLAPPPPPPVDETACAESPTQCEKRPPCASYIYCVYTANSTCQFMPASCQKCDRMGYIYCMHDRLRDLLAHMEPNANDDYTINATDINDANETSNVQSQWKQNETAIDVLAACCRFWIKVG